MRLAATGNSKSARRLGAAAIGLCLASLLHSAPASAQEGSFHELGPTTLHSNGVHCPERFHMRLEALAERALPRIKTAERTVRKGRPDLRGAWLIEPAISWDDPDKDAMKAVAPLIRARGRAAWVGSRNEEWIARRLGMEIADYLGQEAGPYLCSNVGGYLSRLGKYVDRLAADKDRGPQGAAEIERHGRAAIAAFETLLGPIPKPHWAQRAPAFGPFLQTDSVVAEALRPGFDWQRDTPEDRGFGPRFDPALPPRAITGDAIRFDREEDRLALIDHLVRLAVDKGILDPRQTEPPIGTSTRPVLARLAVLAGPVDRMNDVAVRDRLRDALSRIEALDYLYHRPSTGNDALVAAFRETFSGIEQALAQARAIGASVGLRLVGHGGSADSGT